MRLANAIQENGVPGAKQKRQQDAGVTDAGVGLPSTDDTTIVTICQGKTAEGSVNSFG